MPANQISQNATENEFSEEVDYILSSLPRWLKRWNLYVILSMFIGGGIIILVVSQLVRKPVVYTKMQVYPGALKVSVDKVSGIKEILHKQGSLLKSGDTIARLYDLENPQLTSILRSPGSGRLKTYHNYQPNAIIRPGQVIAVVEPTHKKTILGEFKLDNAQASQYKEGQKIRIEIKTGQKTMTIDGILQEIVYPAGDQGHAILYYEVSDVDQLSFSDPTQQLQGRLIEKKMSLSLNTIF